MTAPTFDGSPLSITLFQDSYDGRWVAYVTAQPLPAKWRGPDMVQVGDGPHSALENLLTAPATAESEVGR